MKTYWGEKKELETDLPICHNCHQSIESYTLITRRSIPVAWFEAQFYEEPEPNWEEETVQVRM